MIRKIEKTVLKYNMFSASTDITVALSGGADSVCLLYVLNELKEKFNLNISAFHLNHCLRGEESERDEKFVRELCEKMGIPLIVERADIAAEAERSGESIELCARNIRYKLYKEYSKGLVAVAHTESDNLETIIYNLARGSGIKGLCGIPPVRDIYIRPLIECTRAEVEDYLRKNGVDYVTDSSNLTDEYRRNFIRHNIVPLMKELNTSVEQTVGANCETLREDAEFIESVATKIYAIVAKEDRIDAAMLSEQPKAIAKRVIGMLYYEVSGALADGMHLCRMYDALMSGEKVSLPFNLCAKTENGWFIISSATQSGANYSYRTEIEHTDIKNCGIVYNLLLKNAIDCDKIRGRLEVRTRCEGDSICLANRKCTKSLKKLFNELKVPLSERNILPVAADDEGVVWIYGIGVADRVKVDSNTVKAAIFNVTKIN